MRPLAVKLWMVMAVVSGVRIAEQDEHRAVSAAAAANRVANRFMAGSLPYPPVRKKRFFENGCFRIGGVV